MEFSLTTPALLFSAISLLLLAYTNRFLALAALVRELHKQYKQTSDTIALRQIYNLRLRIKIIKNMQLLGAFSFFFCTGSMLSLFVGKLLLAEIIFGGALLFLMGSLVLSAWEINISVDALNMRLEDIESSGNQSTYKQ